MKPGIPWSVKGIEPDVREAAKQAARRSGMTLGEWLNSTIMDSAEDAPLPAKPSKEPAVRPTVPQSANALERTASRLEDIAEQLSRLSRRDMETSPRVEAAPPQEALQRVLARVESNERQTVEAFTAVNDRLGVIGRQLAQASKARTETRLEEHPAYTSLEKAVRNIVEHMETAEKRNRDNFKSLQDRLASMAAKAASAPHEQVLRQVPALTQLESRLGDLAKRVEQAETAKSQTALPELLRQELTELADRIDTVRDSAEALAQRAQTQAVQASQQELRAIEQRIVGLIREAQSSLMGGGAGPAEMQRLRGEIERLNVRIDEAARSQASGGDVLALRAAVEQLSTRVAQGADLRPLADMDQRIADLSQRLERTQAETRSLPQFGEIERRIAELDHKLNEAVVGRSSAAASELEDRLSEIAGRVERTEHQFTSLETIERAVNQLFDSIEQQKAWTEQVAENAASRMAQQIMAQGPQQVSLAGAPEIEALQQGLQAVRLASESADQRNQETLEAVHDTLEQIVGKLTELETAAIGQRVAAAVAPEPDLTFASAPASGQGFETVAHEPQPAFAGADPAPEQNVFATQPAQHAETVNPFDIPAAASTEMPPQPVNPFDAIIQNGRESLQAGAVQAESDDFIAAARRAAQASYQPKSILSGVAPDLARVSEESSKKLLNLGFLKRKPVAAAQTPANKGLTGEIGYPPGFKPAANENNGKRRKLILMGLVLLAAVSAYTFNMMNGTRKAKIPVKPAAIEQTMEQPAEKAAPPAAAASDENSAEVVDKFENADDGTNDDTYSGAAPPQPKPAELESSLEGGADSILTSSTSTLDGENDLAALIAGSDTSASTTLPPKETGTLALREAAANGNAKAQFVIATRYLNGEQGAPQDDARAAYWFGRSAAQGLAPAQYRLGTLYERGKGVARDINAALGWYERAAGLGNVRAMHNAAVLAASKDGREPDYVKAFKWFSLGAAHGLKDSQFNLAVLLERGLGTKANAKEALFWYSAAASQNDADAAKRAAVLIKALGHTEGLAAKQRLDNWKPETAPDAANVVSVKEASWGASGTAG
jgi:localization factor PodJL